MRGIREFDEKWGRDGWYGVKICGVRLDTVRFHTSVEIIKKILFYLVTNSS